MSYEIAAKLQGNRSVKIGNNITPEIVSNSKVKIVVYLKIKV